MYQSKSNKALVAAAVVVLALTAAACGDDDEASSDTTVADNTDDGSDAESEATQPEAVDDGDGSDTTVATETTAPGATENTNAAEPGANEAYGPVTLGYDSIYLVHPGSQTWKIGMECSVEAYGGEIIALDANLDINQEIANIDQFILEGVDAIASLPLDPTVLAGAYEKAADAGIPVIEMLNPDSEQAGQAWTAYDEMGQTIVDRVVERFGTDAVILYVDGGPISTLIRQKEAVLAAAEAAGVAVEIVPLVEPFTEIEVGQKTVGDALLRIGHVDAIVTTDDNLSIGAALAAQDNGLDISEMEIIGSNLTDQGLQAVQDGTITASYGGDQFELGYRAGLIAMQLAAGESPEPYVEQAKRWDASNIDDFVPYDQRCDARSAG